MNGQPDRCDRTAYVSGLQPTISDIELFEVFNRVAHVEKVIVRQGVVRHALVVFKTVEGLYQVLVNFQGTYLHGRQLHIRPLRESSHANVESIATMVEKARHQGQNRRPASVQEHYSPSQPTPFVPYVENKNNNKNQNSRGYRNSSGSYGKRRPGYNKVGFPNETYAGQQFFDTYSNQAPPCSAMGNEKFQFEDYAEGAKRFDNLANLIRSSTPTDPFANYQKNSDSNASKTDPRARVGSAREKPAPPTWKMELQIKKNETEEGTSKPKDQTDQAPEVSMSPQMFLAQIAHAEQQQIAAIEQKKKRPNLSVINPSLFYDLYPRTSSPVGLIPRLPVHGDKILSPHDPAVLAYSRMRAPQSVFAGLSPIDTNNCSFVTKHLGSSCENPANQLVRRDMTNEELSDMIVSTGNLRLDPVVGNVGNPFDQSTADEPAPWSPVKRLRAESGSLSTANFVSPQFSPIKQKSVEFNGTEDDVFSTENEHPKGPNGNLEGAKPSPTVTNNVLVEQNMQIYEDINNSRLPSNSHSAAPNSDKKAFLFPDYPLCRHSSVPSIAHLVGDLSDSHFGIFDHQVTAGGKLAFDHSSFLREYQNSYEEKSWDSSEKEKKTLNQPHAPSEDLVSLI